MTPEEMEKRRQELGITEDQLSALSHVPLMTVHSILNKEPMPFQPEPEVYQALEWALRVRPEEWLYRETQASKQAPEKRTEKSPDRDRDSGWELSKCGDSSTNVLREAGFVYGTSPRKEHLYTIEERDALPDDIRTELIDGVLYDMAAPAIIHQRILAQLYQLFLNCQMRHQQNSCEIIIAPADVVLGNDGHTAVQPDLMVICDPAIIHQDRIYGAPDLVVEILSPSTKSKDQFTKLNKYKDSGVKEYWLVDPDKRTVTVYLLAVMRGDPDAADGDEISVYRFSSKVPIWISSGNCSIDMSSIGRKMDTVWADASKTWNL